MLSQLRAHAVLAKYIADIWHVEFGERVVIADADDDFDVARRLDD